MNAHILQLNELVRTLTRVHDSSAKTPELYEETGMLLERARRLVQQLEVLATCDLTGAPEEAAQKLRDARRQSEFDVCQVRDLFDTIDHTQSKLRAAIGVPQGVDDVVRDALLEGVARYFSDQQVTRSEVLEVVLNALTLTTPQECQLVLRYMIAHFVVKCVEQLIEKFGEFLLDTPPHTLQ